MGKHALSAAVQTFFAAGNAVPKLFDEAILAAADEVNTTLETAGQSAMFNLRSLATRISVYASVRDMAMDLSMGVNHNEWLGFNGPAQKGDATLYPPTLFRSVDCTQVFDYFGLVPPDATHQYYRRSKCVHHDIVTLMAGGAVLPGVSELRASP